MGISAQALVVSGIVVAGAAGLITVAARNITTPAPAQPVKADPEVARRQRGAYLMASIGCNDCHSPHDNTGNLIPGREMSGHPEGAPLPEWDPSLMDRNILVTIGPTFTAFAGPFGVSVAPNLTPDKETGIGNLTADALIQSWRTGKHWKVDRPIMPPMPAPFYANLTDEDIRSLHAYLMSQIPVKNRPPESRPAPGPG